MAAQVKNNNYVNDGSICTKHSPILSTYVRELFGEMAVH